MSVCPALRSVPRISVGTRSSWSVLRAGRCVGRELGVNHETQRGWVNAAKHAQQRAAGSDGDDSELSSTERDELRRLRRKVAELETEKEILRKAAAYFAKEMGR